MSGSLYVVATPIGNLTDLTERARATLSEVDVVLAEDTRLTGVLLAHFGIRRPLRALHAHNEAQSVGQWIEALQAGQQLALVSDAGTPAVSDPGARLVRAAHAAGVRVVPIPGASAAIAAVSVAGFDGPFLFLGFLPEKEAARRKALATQRDLAYTLVYYEAPHRVAATVEAMAEILGGTRRLVIGRELTKLYESVRSMPLGEAPAWIESDPNHTRGEFVLVVEGGTAEQKTDDAADQVLSILLESLPLSQAVALAARITGERKNHLYSRALAMGRTDETDHP